MASEFCSALDRSWLVRAHPDVPAGLPQTSMYITSSSTRRYSMRHAAPQDQDKVMQDLSFPPEALPAPIRSEPPAPRTTSVPLHTGAKELSRLLSPTDMQIDKPQRIPADQLRPFQTGLQQLLLLPAQSKKLVLATLGVLQATYLCADTNQAVSLSAYKDRVLLVIFPVSPTQHYVLQTWITEVYLDRLRLRYQDPRYDRRWTFQVAAPVILHTAPADLVSLLERDQVRLERETIRRGRRARQCDRRGHHGSHHARSCGHGGHTY